LLADFCWIVNFHLGVEMTASTASESAHEQHGSGSGLYIALVPWVAFTLLAQHSTARSSSLRLLRWCWRSRS
jgi:hypothetical protein